jgi:hypothetical protein
MSQLLLERLVAAAFAIVGGCDGPDADDPRDHER